MSKAVGMGLAALLIVLSAPSAQACRYAGLHTYTFFKELRQELLASERVGRVDVLKTQGGVPGRVTTVQVITPLKGLRKGDVFLVLSDLISCQRDHGISAGDRFYIAGEFDERGHFIGSWGWQDNYTLGRID